MSTFKLNKALNTSLLIFRKGRLFVLLFFLVIHFSFAQPGNDKQVFDLNDPRNPNCPCHKYQKMADDEFEQLQKKMNLNQSGDLAELEDDQNLNLKESQSKDSGNLSKVPHSNFSKNKKRKVVKRRGHKHIKLFTLKPLKTKRFKPSYSVCFKW